MGSNGHHPPRSQGVLRRLLRGRDRVAFVLSGGASLGSIQVGMLRALFEADIRPDMLVGTSVGAVNATWMAAWPSTEGVARLAEIWLGLRREDVFPLGWAAATGLMGLSIHLVSNAGLRSLLERNLPYQRIEQAAVPVHVMTSELKSGRAVVMSSGPVVDAVLASCAIPGIFPPVTIGRRELVDGGVANHTSIEAAVKLGAGKIYVLPISYPWMYEEPSNALGMALQALARMVAQRLDAEVAAYQDAAEIIVIPPLEAMAVSPADFSHTAELMERGYAAARKTLGAAARQAVLKPSTAQASAA